MERVIELRVVQSIVYVVKMIKKIILLGLITVILLIVILTSNIVSAQICSVEDTKLILKKALFTYLPDPESSNLNVSEIKDLLDFYLNSSNLTSVKCDITATLSYRTYESIIIEFSSFLDNVTLPTCQDGTFYGECSSTSSNYCFDGKLIDRQECVSTTETISCGIDSDCIPILYYFCKDNNVYVAYDSNYTYTCINPGGIDSYCINSTQSAPTQPSLLLDKCDINNSEYCFSGLDTCQLTCSDKTRYNQCSSTIPNYCSNGNLVNNCSLCGCPAYESCQGNGECLNIIDTGSTLVFNSAENKTAYLKIPKSMNVSNVNMDLTSPISSNLDIGNDGSYEWILNIYDVHEREWVGSCSTSVRYSAELSPGGKLGLSPKGFGSYTIRIFPLGGKINSNTIDEAHVLIKPNTTIVMDSLQLEFIDGELKGMGVTTDVSICKINEENVASACSSSLTQLFTNYSLSNIQSGWTKIPLENELTLSSGFWKIMFTMNYPNTDILPINSGIGINLCGYEESGDMLFTNLSGKGYYETGSVFIQLVNEETSDFVNPINNYLNTCTPDSDGNCLVPLVFHSDSAGTIKISNAFANNKTMCLDNTTLGECSITNPLYCDNRGELKNACSICGCPSGNDCLSDGSCIPFQGSSCNEGGTGLFNICDEVECNSIPEGCFFIDGLIVNSCNVIMNVTFDNIAYYNFENTSGNILHDVTGNGNDGTLINNPTNTAGKTELGNALHFIEASRQYVNMSYTIPGENGTISFWWKVPSVATSEYLMGLDIPVEAPVGEWKFMNLDPGKTRFGLFNPGTFSVDGSDTTSDNTWTHTVAVWGTGGIRLYSDGVLVGTDSTTLRPNYTNWWWVGGDTTEYANADIDELGIWNRRLSAGEVADLYNNGQGKTYPNPVLPPSPPVNETNQTITCQDGTPYDQCSTTKPLYCSNGNLRDDCSTCGCPSGNTCKVNGKCIIDVKTNVTWDNIAYYNFENVSWHTLYDVTGNGNDGTLRNIENQDWTSGKPGLGNALIFNRSNSWVDMPYNIQTLAPSGTLTFWIKPNGTGGGTYGNSIMGMEEIGANSGNWEVYSHELGDGSRDIKWFLENSLSDTILISNTTLSVNTWAHVALLWGGGGMKFYVNGELQSATDTRTDALKGPWAIGRVLGGKVAGNVDFYTYYDGTIDEVGLWNRRLDANEVANLYNSGIGKTYPNPIIIIVDETNKTCTDSDGGENYFVRGQVDSSVNGTLSDSCGANDRLTENYCTPTNSTAKSFYDCPYGCTNGACLEKLTTFSDGSSIKNLTFNETGNQTVYLKIGKESNVTSSELTLEGFSHIGSFPRNPSLDVGNNGVYEWTYSGEFQTIEMVSNFSREIEEYLNACSQDAEGNCLVPLVFHSDSSGMIIVSNISVIHNTNPMNPDSESSIFERIWNFIKELFQPQIKNAHANSSEGV